MAVLSKDLPGRGSAVHNDDWDVAKLDLVDVAIGFGPLSVLLRCIYPDIRDVAYDRPARGAIETLEPGILSFDFVGDKAGGQQCEDEGESTRDRDRKSVV